ncbi:MAG: histidinol-phosphate transaminase [Rhodobacteraceae bacterium]|nr:histidinol-phosphate transaminase [Paracoccaceae bacterium]
MAKIAPQPGIMDVALYQGGKAALSGVANVIKLSANENPLGPSPKAIAAYEAASRSLNVYPSSDHAALRDAIGEVHGLDPAQIICGAGSDEVITFLCQAFAGPGTEVIHTYHGFAMHRISALVAGATPVEAPERERRVDVDAILSLCNEKTRLVFVANPANPTGTMISAAEVERLADNLPATALLVLDGAYVEFVDGFDGGAALIMQRDNVVMTRTFSKIYGLGGLRIGWGFGPQEIIDVLNRVRGPFNLSHAALTAAEAAVRDVDYTDYCRAQNTQWKTWLADQLAELGVPSDVSLANFILARFASPEEATACNDVLQNHGIIVRPVANYNLPSALRMTVGDEAGCRRIVGAVKAFRDMTA